MKFLVQKTLSAEKINVRNTILSSERQSFSREGRETFSAIKSQTLLTEAKQTFFTKKSDESDDDDFWNIPITVKGDFESEDEEWYVTPTVEEENMVVVKENFDKAITSKESIHNERVK